MVGFTEELPRSLLAPRNLGAGLLHTYRDTSLEEGRGRAVLPYSYALNSPLNYVDPDGRIVFAIPLGIAGLKAAGAALAGTATLGGTAWCIGIKGKRPSTWDRRTKKRPGAAEKKDRRMPYQGKNGERKK